MQKNIIVTSIISVLLLTGCSSQTTDTLTSDLELTKYNCELSLGTFENGTCTCPLENDQTQEEMYDETTGFCQSTMGGPAGAALEAATTE